MKTSAAEPGKPVLTAFSGGVLRIRFNRPQALNAIDAALAEALLAACREAGALPGLRAVLLSGEGRAFMAGGDLSQLPPGRPDRADAVIQPLHEALRRLVALPVPVIAALHGGVAGAALGVALAADLAVAAPSARFTFAYDRVGASPDAGTSWSLVRALGLRRALGFALLGDTIDAGEALRLGLVHRVSPEDGLERESLALAERLAAGPTAALGRTKSLLRGAAGRDLEIQLNFERDAFLTGVDTADFAEGVAAFLGKRTAVFRGR